MRIRPRQQLLEIWQAIARHSFSDGVLDWGKLGGSSSVSDAEQLLCLMYPASELPPFRLDAPDETAEDVLAALKGIGDNVEIPTRLISALAGFMDMHTSDTATPTFSAGHYLFPVDPDEELTPEQRELGVVDSYSMSISLALSTLGFLKIFKREIRRDDLRDTADALYEATSVRLTAAMVSLLRSFTVNLFDADSPRGHTLCRTVNQSNMSNRLVVQELQRELRPLRASIKEYFTLGLNIVGDLDNNNLLMECGWSWGIVQDAPQVDTTDPVGTQPKGVAIPAPYLYFTVVALDGIADLFSERTLILGLLNEEQQRLAQALRLRWELTQQYWSMIARFGDEKWPLEDIPWRTTGQQQESEYFSLLVASILVQDLDRRRATDDDLTRTVAVMEELAVRAKITRRMTSDDPTVSLLHNPGVRLPLTGGESLGPAMQWSVPDFSTQLLKRTLQLCSMSRRSESHDRLLGLAEQVMDHLWLRRISSGPGIRLWDNISAVFPDLETAKAHLSWNMTERVVECMVVAANLFGQPPIRSPQLTELATSLLSEAGHIFDREMMEPSSAGNNSLDSSLRIAEMKMARARQILDDRPGTSFALTMQVLTSLDELVVARRAATKRA
ncbi:SCO2524 family protein [Actinacidiphila oryziradicis]|uniref:Uncharacterized protein n=1 Tax=Actinacidiphila oryziradicis TaxID=2571141 RepID=A0A4U0SFP9_9ACTN|nr:SCO2524 family protein [Actinacidiphila oryziradicis]TKA06601.1 hypothetical protein FCI23_30675 [Actinacidiphila oryziradicis]